eukprot:jgi/Tetstr1/421153/TSEL_012196.t1
MPLSGHSTVEPAAAMALHKTAFTDKLQEWLKQSKPNVSMLTEEAWALAKRDVLAWDSILASERDCLLLALAMLLPGPVMAAMLLQELADAITTQADLNNALDIPEDMAIDADSPATSGKAPARAQDDTAGRPQQDLPPTDSFVEEPEADILRLVGPPVEEATQQRPRPREYSPPPDHMDSWDPTTLAIAHHSPLAVEDMAEEPEDGAAIEQDANGDNDPEAEAGAMQVATDHPRTPLAAAKRRFEDMDPQAAEEDGTPLATMPFRACAGAALWRKQSRPV